MPISPDSLASLRAKFKGPIVTPDDPDYATSIDRFFASSVKPAGAVAFPTDDADITSALAWAQAGAVELVVKGGGHSVSGASSTDGGLVLDLSKSYKTVAVDPATSTALVGGGAKWGDVDQAAIKHGLAVVGGTNDDTGVSGLTLGGGFGWRTSDLGMVCDNVLEFRAILADGSSVLVNAASEPDLFFALRGGGGNFCVVTHFKFQLHPQAPEVFFHQSMHGPGALADVAAIVEAGNVAGDAHSNISMGFVPAPNGQPIVVAFGYVNRICTAEEGKAVFSGLHALKPMMAHESMIPYEKLNTMMNPHHPAGDSIYMTTKMLPTFERHYIVAVGQRHLEMTAANAGFKLECVIQPLKFGKGSQIKPDETAFPYRSPQLCICALIIHYERPDQKEQARRLCRELRDGPCASGQTPVGVYANGDSQPDSRLESLYGANWARLSKVKRAVDPTGVFGRKMLASQA